jgi:hypothetical protein
MKFKALIATVLVAWLGAGARISQAGVPFNNLEGVGGVAFNPIAYLADCEGDQNRFKVCSLAVTGLPRFGGWYVNLDSVNVDWTAFGVADTFFKRVEVSYGYETIAQSGASTKHKNNVGAKVLLVQENLNGNKFIPAISVGSIYKTVSPTGVGVDDSDFDFYLVATKLITQLPRPVLLSAGVRSTKGKVTGVFGFDKNRKETAFANLDLLVTDKIVVGYEYEQGARFSDFKNADYWDAHVAWLVNKNLSLIAAYVNAGDQKSSKRVGLGDGVVLSAQYAF